MVSVVADGATTREISERLFISAKTADNHIQHIYTKLGVTNRAAATGGPSNRGSSPAPQTPECKGRFIALKFIARNPVLELPQVKVRATRADRLYATARRARSFSVDGPVGLVV